MESPVLSSQDIIRTLRQYVADDSSFYLRRCRESGEESWESVLR